MNGTTFRQREDERIMATYSETEGVPTWEQKGYEDITKVMDAMKVIIDFGNNMSRKPEQTAEILIDALEVNHRTLQQGVISALIQTLVFYAEARCDGRNEYSVNTCKAIAKFLEEQNLTYNRKYSAPCI